MTKSELAEIRRAETTLHDLLQRSDLGDVPDLFTINKARVILFDLIEQAERRLDDKDTDG